MGYQFTDIKEISVWLNNLNNNKTYDNNIKCDAFKVLSIMINNGKLKINNDKFIFNNLIFKKNTNTLNFFQKNPTKQKIHVFIVFVFILIQLRLKMIKIQLNPMTMVCLAQVMKIKLILKMKMNMVCWKMMKLIVI